MTTDARLGADVLVEFAIADAAATPAADDWKTLGMMRGKEIGVSWDEVDATADKSPNRVKESLVTFKAIELSGDGVSRDNDIHNQELLEGHVNNPTATGGQPVTHFRVTWPAPAGKTKGKKYQGPFMVKEFKNSMPHDNVCTWNISASSAGGVAFTPSAV